MGEYFGTSKGVLVNSVEADSPAARAGLKAGDVVTAVNGKAVGEPSELIEAVQAVDDGATLAIDYTRDNGTDTSARYDVIIDTGGHRRLSDLRHSLTRRGVLVIVGSETDGRWLGGFDRSVRAQLLSPFVSQKLRMLASIENAADLDALRELVESGRVASAVDRVYPLRETAAAIRHMIDGHALGKIVIAI